jgi:EmrB/QacA subfamily drug resistance transporter
MSQASGAAKRQGMLALPEDPHIPAPPRLFWQAVPPIVLPVFLAAADGTMVATALPAIAASFGEVEALSWVVVANLIAGTVAAPAYGRLADLFGRRRMMVLALLVFMAASLLCALAPSFRLLLAARVLQGLGGGGLMTLAQALVGEVVPPRQRGSYQGYLSTCIVAGTTAGPVMGGFITQLWGWHAVFLAYLPIGAVAIALVMRLPRRAGGGQARFDLPGLVLLTAFIVPLLLAVSQLQRLHHEMLPRLGLLVALAAAGLAALVWQQNRAAAPLLALRLQRHPAFWRSDVMAACSGASLTAMITFLPIYLQVVTGASAAEAGLLLIPLTGAVAGGSVVTGWLISHTGRTAIFPTIGLMVTAVTLVALAIWGPGMSRPHLSWVLALGGLCQGSSMITAQITVQIVGGARQLGTAAASVQLCRSLGSAFGTAVAGAVLFGLLSLLDSDTAALFLQMVQRGRSVLDALPADHRALVQGEIATAFRGVFLTIACFSATIVAMAATLPVRRL